MINYSKIAAVAKKLISENGREVSFVKNSQIPADVSKPWNGPISSGKTALNLKAVFVPPNMVRQFGLSALGEGTQFQDLIAFSEQILITFPEENDLSQYRTILDGNREWNMIGLQVLKPADVQLLAFVGTRR